jgi:hypothetical protein
MKAALLTLALLGGQSLVQVSDRVPHLNVEALCKQTSDIDKAMNLAEAQSTSDCIRDETAAQQQLTALWATAPASVRDHCEAEATLADMASYVDLLSCMQMADLSPVSSTDTLRGGSKNRNKKQEPK